MFEYLPSFADTPETVRIETISDLLGIILNVLLGVTVTVSVIALIYGGILYATSTGDPKAIGRAKATVMYSVLALILAIGAMTVKVIILNILGVTEPTLLNATPGF